MSGNGRHGSAAIAQRYAPWAAPDLSCVCPDGRLQQKAFFWSSTTSPGARSLAHHRADHRRLCRRVCLNYQDAIYRIRNNVPDIILCDYMLGDGRSGQQLLEELRRFNLLPDETIFMMVTGEQSYEQVVSAVELVPDDYIIKPFSPDKLVLRLDRIVAKKISSPSTTRKSARRNSPRPWPSLEAQRNSEAGRPYRFEILRQQAEVLLASGDAKSAEAGYRSILENYEFPWARAGVARSCIAEPAERSAQEIDRVVASTPHFFDAADLKASICMAQGEHAEAQQSAR
jgi:DNA-binding response OmpR family regulator